MKRKLFAFSFLLASVVGISAAKAWDDTLRLRVNYLAFPVQWDGKTVMLGARFQAPLNVTGKIPAVIMLHNGYGVNYRGVYYAAALNSAGIATLEIDQYGGRGHVGGPLKHADVLSDIGGAYRRPATKPLGIAVHDHIIVVLGSVRLGENIRGCALMGQANATLRDYGLQPTRRLCLSHWSACEQFVRQMFTRKSQPAKHAAPMCGSSVQPWRHPLADVVQSALHFWCAALNWRRSICAFASGVRMLTRSTLWMTTAYMLQEK